MHRLVIVIPFVVLAGCAEPAPPEPPAESKVPDEATYLQERKAREGQYRAVWTVQQRGGSVTWDSERAPRLVLGVNLSGTEVKDADLALLVMLPEVTEIDLSGTGVTDGGVMKLTPLQNLARLTLSGTQVTEEGAQRLRDALPGCWVRR